MKIKITGWEKGCEETQTRRKHKKNEREEKRTGEHKQIDEYESTNPY